MKENLSLFERAKAFIRAHHRRSVWYRIISVLGVFVVFVTTYMLVLPAITMVKGELICGMEEHVHNSDCYTTKYTFTCGQDEESGHEHTDDCITSLSVLTCQIPEHYHEESCYAQTDDTPDAPAPASAEITPAQAPASDDGELVIDNTPEQEALPELPTEPETTAEETETETEAEPADTLAWDSTTEPVRFGIRLKLKEGAFAEGSVLDVEYLDEAKAAPYIETLKNQLASAQEGQDADAAVLLPMRATVRDASGNALPTAKAELSIYMEDLAGTISEDTLLFANYDAQGVTWEEEEYDRIPADEAESGHLQADVDAAGVFVLADVRYTERAAETEQPTEAATEQATEAATEQATEAATEKATEAANASGAQQNNPSANSWGGFGGAGIEEPGIGDETGRTFVQNADGTLQEAGQPGTETEEIKETNAQTETESGDETDAADTEDESESETENKSETEAPAGDFAGGNYMGGDPGLGFEDNGELTQGKEPEQKETENGGETGAQYMYICGLAEHTHTEECYDEDGNLVCGLEEHTHTDECIERPMADETQNGVTRGSGTDLLKDPNTKISGSGTTYNSETGEFKTNLRFDYELNKSDVVNNAKYEYFITIPDGIIVPAGLVGEAKTFNDVNIGDPAGTYEFVKGEDGKYSIKIHFDPTYVAGAGDTLKGFVGFEGFLEKDAYQANGNLRVEFEDGQELVIPTKDITFDHDETFNYDIDISKEGHYEIKGNKLVYTVTIKSLKGTPDPIKFEDILSAAGLNVKGQPEVTVQWGRYKHYTEYWEPKDEEKVTKTDIKWSYDSASKKLTIDLPRLNPGEEGEDPNGRDKYIYAEYYDITYEYSLDDLPADAKISADNTATVESRDTTTGELVTDSSSKHIDVSTEMTFTKGGWYNSAGKYIEWTLTLNSNKLDIAGATIEDEMLPENAEDITVDPKEGWTLDSDGKILFTAIGDTGVNTNAYTIKYKTPVETTWDGTTEKNSATFDWDGTPGGDDEKTASQEVTTSGGSVDKQFVEADEIKPDDTTVEVTWKTKIVVPDGGLPANVVLTDTTSNPYSEDDKKHYMTPAQIKALVESIKSGGNTEAITWPAGGEYDTSFTDESGNTYTYEDIQKPENVNVHIVKFEITIKSLSASAGEYWFTYNTTADIAGAQRGANTYYNNVEIGGKKDGDTYTFREGGVVKTDGNNQAGTTDVTNEGTLSWKVKASVDSRAQYKELKIVDKLPEHILLSEIAFDYNKLTIQADGTFEGTANGYKISGKYDEKTREVEATITRENPEKILDPNKDFEILYTCSVDKENLQELEDGQKYEFTNEVTVYKDGVEFGTDKQTQTWTEQIPVVEEKKIEKLGVWDNDNRQIDYEVVINPKAEDLVLNSDELTLTDTLEYVTGNNEGINANFDRNVSLIQGSVKLYEAQRDESGELVRDETGKLKKGELITNWEWVYNEESKPNPTWGEAITNTITGKIPDGKALILVYSYRVQMNYASEGWHGDVNISVSNKVRIDGTGIEDDSYNKEDAWEGQSSSGGVYTDKNYTFYKVEKGSYGVALKDAKFTIYKVDKNGNETEVTESITDTSGKFQIVWQNNGLFEKNTLYYAVEKEAPNGYIKPENPPKYYFYFGDGTADLPDNIPDGAVNLSATSHAAYIENEKNDTDIEVDKKWLDADGNDVTAGTDGKVEFNLYRKESLTPPDPSASEESSGNSGSTTGGSSGGSNEIVIKWNNQWDQVYHTGFKANPGDTVEISLAYEDLEGCMYGYTPPAGGYENINSGKDSDGKIKFTIVLGDTSETEVNIIGLGYTSIDDNIKYDPSKISFRIVRDEEGSTTPDPDSGSESGGDSGEDPSEEVVEGTLIGTYSIEKASNWIWRSKDVDGLTLPKVGTNAAGETVYYTYYIKEANAEFYNAVYSANNTNGIVSGTITVTNKKPEKELIGLSVKKQWDDKGAPITGEHKPIRVELWKKGYTDAENHGDQKIDEQELNIENGWTYSWTDLDADAEYYVKEVDEITGYDVTYSVNGGAEQSVARDVTARPGNDNPTLVIKNTLRTTSVEVKKVWLSADGTVKDSADADAKLPKITVHLYKENTEGGYVEVAYVELGKDYAGLENYTDDGWGYTWPNLPEGKYYVEEDRIEGYTVTYHSETMAADATEPTKSESKGTGSEVTVTAGSLVITNTENPTQIEVEKVWTDGNDKHNGDSVTMELYSSTTPPETEQETEPKEPEPEPGTGGTDPVEPEPNPEQTETDSEKPEPVIENVTINIAIDEWLPSGSAAPSNGWAWVGIFECDQTGYVSSYDNSVNLIYKDGDTTTSNLEPENGWHRTVTLPGKITTGGTTEIKYYKIVIDDTPNIDDNGIDYSDSNPLRTLKLKTGEIVNGANGNANVNLVATLASESGGTGGTEGSGGGEGSGETGSGTLITVTVDAWVSNNITTATVDNNNVFVRVKYDWNSYQNGEYGETKSTLELDPETIGGVSVDHRTTEIYDGKYVYDVFYVSGLSGMAACNLTYKFGENPSWGYQKTIIEPDNVATPASFSLSTPTMFISAPVAPISLGSTEPLAKGELKLVGTVTLNSGNNWRHTWDNLPKTDEHGNPLYYYVKETDLGEGYTTTYDYQYVDGDKTKGISKVTVTNTPPEKRTTSVGVQKVWQNEKGATKEAWLNSIQVELLDSGGNQVTGVENPVILNADNRWSYTWPDLPEGTYYVRETNTGETVTYTVKYSNSNSNGTESETPEGAAVTAGIITITNQSTSVSVDKKWVDKNGDELTSLEGKEVKVQLYRVKDGADDEKVGEPVALNGNGEFPWYYEWSNLPLGEYYVVEEPEVEGFTALYTNSTESMEEPKPDLDLSEPKNAKVASGTITITNYEDTEIEVEKVWADKKDNHEPITVKLYSSTTPPNTDIVGKNKETASIASTMKLSLGVTDWVDDDKNEAEPITNGSVWMTVQACDSTGEPLLDENGEAVVYANRLTASNNWHQTTQELPATVTNENGETETKYYLLRFGSENADTQNGIQGLSVLNGPNETNGIVISGNASKDGKLSYNLQATVAGTGTLQPRIDNTRMMMLNSGEGGGDSAETTVDGLDLPENKKELDEVTLKEGNALGSYTGTYVGEYGKGGLSFKWQKLPTVNENGERLYYYVQEDRDTGFKYNTDYKYQYMYKEDGKTVTGVKLVTITNTPNKISITAYKVWNWNDLGPKTDEDKKKLESQFRVTLSLLKDGNKVTQDTTLTNNNWSVTWGDLEAGHTYEVVEYSVETSPYNFKPTIEYSWGDKTTMLDQSGTVTVTNTYNPNPYKLPETGGTGTLPYTVGGALLTALATLLLYIQNKRRKEGQGTS